MRIGIPNPANAQLMQTRLRPFRRGGTGGGGTPFTMSSTEDGFAASNAKAVSGLQLTPTSDGFTATEV